MGWDHVRARHGVVLEVLTSVGEALHRKQGDRQSPGFETPAPARLSRRQPEGRMMINIPDVPPAIYEQAAQQDTQAQSQSDRLAREAARRAVEQATVQKGQPTHGGR